MFFKKKPQQEKTMNLIMSKKMNLTESFGKLSCSSASVPAPAPAPTPPPPPLTQSNLTSNGTNSVQQQQQQQQSLLSSSSSTASNPSNQSSTSYTTLSLMSSSSSLSTSPSCSLGSSPMSNISASALLRTCEDSIKIDGKNLSNETQTNINNSNDNLYNDEYFKFSTYINRNMTEKQIRELFYQDYMLGSEIGKGGFGTIFSGLRRADDLPVAIKIVKKSRVTQWYELDRTNEISNETDNIIRNVENESGISSESTSPCLNAENLNECFRNNSPITDLIHTRRIPLEIALMIKVRNCKNCIRIIDYLEQKNCFIIIMERILHSKDLFDLITEFSHSNHLNTSPLCTGLDESLAKVYFKQIVETVLEIHDMGVLHRDIKDENILIDLETNQIKLIDFGAGTFLRNNEHVAQVKLNDFHGTRVYSPPEWILNKSYYGDRACVWSLGVLLFNMIYGDIPWEEDNDIVNCRLYNSKKFQFTFFPQQQQNQASLENDNNNNDSNSINNNSKDRLVDDLIRSCLTINDLERIKLEDILKHKWFDV